VGGGDPRLFNLAHENLGLSITSYPSTVASVIQTSLPPGAV
jgi:hypothetical protein